MLVPSSRSPGGLWGYLGRVGRDETRVSWDFGRCSSPECPPSSAAPRLEDIPVDAALSWKYCSVVFPVLPLHNQPNIGNLELSLKHKSLSGLVCRGGLAGTEELVPVPVCCTEDGAVLGVFPILWLGA